MKHAGDRRIVLAVLAIIFLMTAGCPKKEEIKNKPPEVTSIKLSPIPAKVGESVRASVSVDDKEADPVSIEYQWYVNGDAVKGAVDMDFDTSEYYEDDEVYVKARGVDEKTGVAGEWSESKAFKLGGEPPPELAGVKIEPAPLTAMDAAEAVVDYGDMDPMDVDEIYYRWKVNGKVIEDEEESSLEPEYFKFGDKVQVEICTNGNFESPDLWTSSTYPVANSVPEFTTMPEAEIRGNYAIITFEAEDPDGDQVSYFIQGGPPGAKLDKAGRIVIDMSKTRAGTYDMVIGARDSHGGTAGTNFSMEIPEQK